MFNFQFGLAFSYFNGSYFVQPLDFGKKSGFFGLLINVI